ncbi:hypothetical protein CR152_28785 [Massilia violaceinigra]|uniref:Uncharacterized protein n=1 Tax=Massilia violaceinigra TaxID=2045208 RepID=A0A2D2DSV7_9BURK|nr:hypothetical protein [Massilia violaceinigra]ATQ78059.1 hypothetical protein CR152_28785 [Massilia violaceinigra]
MEQSSPRKQTIALQRVDIASPCTASWDKMAGDDRVRHCKDCNKNVFNLSAMPQADAAALLAENHHGELCVRFYRRQDGTVMTSDRGDSPRAAVRQAWRKLPHMAGAAVLALSAAGSSAGDAVPDAKVDAPVPKVTPARTMVMMGTPPRPSMQGVSDATKPALPSGQTGQPEKKTKSAAWMGNVAPPREPLKQAAKGANPPTR